LSNGAAAGDLGLIFDFLVVVVETLASFAFVCYFVVVVFILWYFIPYLVMNKGFLVIGRSMTDVLVKRIHFCVVLFDFQNLPGWNSPLWKTFCLVSTAGSSCNFYTNFLCVSSVPCSNFIEFQALDLQICSSKGVVLRAYQTVRHHFGGGRANNR
jgi:hypothetical protein